jgi:hypothetical protein
MRQSPGSGALQRDCRVATLLAMTARTGVNGTFGQNENGWIHAVRLVILR